MGRTAVAKKKKDWISNVLFQFDSEESANHFWRWMCESGEQQYWDYMSYREMEEDGDITGISFDYSKADSGLVKVKSGRFTENKPDA